MELGSGNIDKVGYGSKKAKEELLIEKLAYLNIRHSEFELKLNDFNFISYSNFKSNKLEIFFFTLAS